MKIPTQEAAKTTTKPEQSFNPSLHDNEEEEKVDLRSENRSTPLQKADSSLNHLFIDLDLTETTDAAETTPESSPSQIDSPPVRSATPEPATYQKGSE